MRALGHGWALVSVVLGALVIYTVAAGAVASLVIRRMKATRPVVTQPDLASLDANPSEITNEAGDLWCADLDPSLVVLDALLDDMDLLDDSQLHVVLASANPQPLEGRGRVLSRSRAANGTQAMASSRMVGRGRGSWSLPALNFRRKERDVTAPPSPAPWYAAAFIATVCVVGALIFSGSGVIPTPGSWSSSPEVTRGPLRPAEPPQASAPSAEHPSNVKALPAQPNRQQLAALAPQPVTAPNLPNPVVVAAPVGVAAQAGPAPVFEISIRTPIASQSAPATNLRPASSTSKPAGSKGAAAKPKGAATKALSRVAAQPAKQRAASTAKPRHVTVAGSNKAVALRQKAKPQKPVRAAALARKSAPVASPVAAAGPAARVAAAQRAAVVKTPPPPVRPPRLRPPQPAAQELHRGNAPAAALHHPRHH